MKIIFAEAAWNGCLYWQKTDRKTVQRINELIQAASRTLAAGIGKPEPL